MNKRLITLAAIFVNLLIADAYSANILSAKDSQDSQASKTSLKSKASLKSKTSNLIVAPMEPKFVDETNAVNISPSSSKDKQDSHRSGVYAGLDLILMQAEHRFIDDTNNAGPIEAPQKLSANNSNASFGANVGYNFVYKDFFVAPELFFDNLSNRSNDFFHMEGDSAAKQDKLVINYRYGFKVNVGYYINDKFSIFVNYGFANVDYNLKFYSASTADTGQKSAPIYGIGFIYKINNTWSMKTSFNYQSFDTPYFTKIVGYGYRDKINLKDLRMGVVYSF
jgi:opacity protein-like surface antigen